MDVPEEYAKSLMSRAAKGSQAFDGTSSQRSDVARWARA